MLTTQTYIAENQTIVKTTQEPQKISQMFLNKFYICFINSLKKTPMLCHPNNVTITEDGNDIL